MEAARGMSIKDLTEFMKGDTGGLPKLSALVLQILQERSTVIRKQQEDILSSEEPPLTRRRAEQNAI